jgi:hypothetical protein
MYNPVDLYGQCRTVMCAAEMCHPIPYSSVAYRTVLISTEPSDSKFIRYHTVPVFGLVTYTMQGISHSDRTRSQDGRVPAPQS